MIGRSAHNPKGYYAYAFLRMYLHIIYKGLGLSRSIADHLAENPTGCPNPTCPIYPALSSPPQDMGRILIAYLFFPSYHFLSSAVWWGILWAEANDGHVVRYRGQSADAPEDPFRNPSRGVRYRISDSIYKRHGWAWGNQIRAIVSLGYGLENGTGKYGMLYNGTWQRWRQWGPI